jgi:hypothetical protein
MRRLVRTEDCFLSRQVLTHPADDDESFFDHFIERTRVRLAEMPPSAHFPMYSNPVAMWERIAEFHKPNNID